MSLGHRTVQETKDLPMEGAVTGSVTTWQTGGLAARARDLPTREAEGLDGVEQSRALAESQSSPGRS